MTTEFGSKESALEMGLYYAGYKDPEQRKKLLGELPEAVTSQLGFPHDKSLNTYLIKNVDGFEVELGVSKFRDGYDLWLIEPKTGFSVRA